MRNDLRTRGLLILSFIATVVVVPASVAEIPGAIVAGPLKSFA